MNAEPAKSFTDLIVWQRAHEFVLATYKLSRLFPNDERFGLTSQFRRAAVSIAANIAEGFRRRGIKDKIKFLNISEGSLDECRYYLILAEDLNYMSNKENQEALAEEISKLLSSYIRTLESKLKP